MALKMLQRGQVACSARPAAARVAVPLPSQRTRTIMRYRDEEVCFSRRRTGVAALREPSAAAQREDCALSGCVLSGDVVASLACPRELTVMP